MPYSVYLKFLGQYMRKAREIGAVSPDSKACIYGLLRSVQLESSRVMIELGAGSGAVTREILRRKSPESTLICFEKNAAFYNTLRNTILGRNVFIVHDDVFDAPGVVSSRFGIPERTVDCIISTLPCSNIRFAELLKMAILPLLNTGGAFVQYMHIPSVLKGFRLKPILNRAFTRIESNIVFLNIPPVLIYTCRIDRGGPLNAEVREHEIRKIQF